MPTFSIIIPVHNDWTALDSCLDSVMQQSAGPNIEVIVIDDGSDEAAPEKIRQWGQSLPLTLIRQAHGGISVARNQGIAASKGSSLLFVDADCRLQANSLAALASTMNGLPQHNYFQLRLMGDCSGSMGRSEHLRLLTLQDQLLQGNGCIRYLNTAGFAMRRSSVPNGRGLFDPEALRAEDTLLLADLMERGELPFFVADASVRHEISRSLLRCLGKDIRSAFLEGGTYAKIAARGIRIRMNQRERWNMLGCMWRESRQASIGRLACLVLVVRQALSRMTSLVYRVLHGKTAARRTNAATINV